MKIHGSHEQNKIQITDDKTEKIANDERQIGIRVSREDGDKAHAGLPILEKAEGSRIL